MNNRLWDMLHIILHEIIEHEKDLVEDEQEIHDTLAAEGYDDEEIGNAFEWLESFFRALPPREGDEEAPATAGRRGGLRVLSYDESMLISPEVFGFLHGLEARGLISHEMTEEIIHRSLNMFEEQIGLDDMKMVTLLTIFEHGRANLDEVLRLLESPDLKSFH